MTKGEFELDKMSEYASKIAVGVVSAIVIGTVIIAGFYYLPQISNKSTSTTTLEAGTTSTISSVGGATTTNFGGGGGTTTVIMCCVSTNQSQTGTYYFSSIPQNFTTGGYSFGTSYEGMHSGSGGNGSTIVYLGQYVVFYVSNSGMTQSVTFSWSPNQNLSDSIPEPSSAELFDGNVVFGTFLNSTGSFVIITVQTMLPTSTSIGTGNQTTVTVTEEIIQESIYTQRACVEQLGVTNTTTYITPSNTAAEANNNTVTVTEVQFTNSTSTTTISPPSFITTVVNGTTLTQACG